MVQKQLRKIRDLLAREKGTIVKEWGGKIPVALVYPNTYAVGMSNLGFLTVYGLLNSYGDVVCERAFLPDAYGAIGFGWEDPRESTRCLSMEHQRELAAFEIVAFSISFENDYTNVVEILKGAGIPVLREQRSGSASYPLIIAGGPVVFLNPEPLADIMDAFLLGEAEQLLPAFLDVYRACRSTSRSDLMRSLCSVPGVYVPEFYRPRYDSRGVLVAHEALEGAPERVVRQWVKDLGACATFSTITTPDTEFGSMFLVEIARGCPRTCPFCSTSVMYRPVRYRSPDALGETIKHGAGIRARFGLVCSSLGDYPRLTELYRLIRAAGGTISAPSIRIDTLDDCLLAMLKESGQKTITLAPETGTERLRRGLGKDIANEDILETIDQLARYGIFGVRLYFMVGVPGETDEDIEAIISLVKQIRHRFLKVAKDTARMGEITLSINPFVPKPWSPFQWCPMEEVPILKERIKRIRSGLGREPNVCVTYGLPKWAFVQALLSRGDRRVGMVLSAEGTASKDWKRTFRALNINPEFYVHRERGKDELFPWDFIDQGISKSSLFEQYQRAMAFLTS